MPKPSHRRQKFREAKIQRSVEGQERVEKERFRRYLTQERESERRQCQ
jgi:hypothetical protein